MENMKSRLMAQNQKLMQSQERARKIAKRISDKIEAILWLRDTPVISFSLDLSYGYLLYQYYDDDSKLVEREALTVNISEELITLLQNEGWEEDLAGHLILSLI